MRDRTMVFNTAVFGVFFCLFWFPYWYLSQKGWLRARNLLILAASYLFYGWWDWRFLSLILISSAADFLLGLRIESESETRGKKRWLAISVVLNLGFLGFFKYFNFFISSFGDLLSMAGLHPSLPVLNIILPVGISFYTFQSLGYTFDVYRGELKPSRDPVAFLAYVAFFPQLVAGPIERAKHLLPQFSSIKVFSYPMAIEGLRYMLWGFFRKIVLADNFGRWADAIFDSPSCWNRGVLLAGLFFFSVQIYCDFSGYSAIATGTARMLGFDLMQNFHRPYFAGSLRSFWQRWHISLSTWFRDYLYFPLGGSRRSPLRNAFNTFLTFLVSGLWHGASLNFVIWGGMHGLALATENAFRKITSKRFPLSGIFVFLFVSVLWIPFRIQKPGGISEWLHYLLADGGAGFSVFFEETDTYIRTICLLLALAFFIGMEVRMHSNEAELLSKPQMRLLRLLFYFALVSAILMLGDFDVAPRFIYFQF